MPVAQGFFRARMGEYLAALVLRIGKSSRNGGLRLKDWLACGPGEAILRVMRKRFEVQLALGKTPIEKVAMPARSRDELPPVLAGPAWGFPSVRVHKPNLLVVANKAA